MADLAKMFDDAVAASKAGKPKEARKGFEKLFKSGDPEWSPRAGYELGSMCMRQNRFVEARQILEQVVAGGHKEWAPLAGINLGVTLTKAGDPIGALQAYSKVVTTGHSEHAAQAAYNLGVTLKERGDLAAAENAYRTAVSTGHPKYAPRSANNLGTILLDLRNYEGAKEMFEYAAASGDAETAKLATRNLAVLAKLEADPDADHVSAKEKWWNGTLLPDEQMVLNVDVLTPKGSYESILATKLMRGIGQYDWESHGTHHAVTLTDRRVRVDQLVFWFDEITAYSYRQWRPTSDTGVVKSTWAMRRIFAVRARNGNAVELEFADDFPQNPQVAEVLHQSVVPKVRPRLVKEALNAVRSGGQFKLTGSGGRLLLGLTEEGFTVSGRDGLQSFPWSGWVRPTYFPLSGTLTFQPAKRIKLRVKTETSQLDVLNAVAAEFRGNGERT